MFEFIKILFKGKEELEDYRHRHPGASHISGRRLPQDGNRLFRPGPPAGERHDKRGPDARRSRNLAETIHQKRETRCRSSFRAAADLLKIYGRPANFDPGGLWDENRESLLKAGLDIWETLTTAMSLTYKAAVSIALKEYGY